MAKWGRPVSYTHLDVYKRQMYVTASPCIECAKLIIQAGIKRVVYSEKYRLEDLLDLLKRANIQVIYINPNE